MSQHPKTPAFEIDFGSDLPEEARQKLEKQRMQVYALHTVTVATPVGVAADQVLLSDDAPDGLFPT